MCAPIAPSTLAWVGVSPPSPPTADSDAPHHRLGLARLEVEHRCACHHGSPRSSVRTILAECRHGRHRRCPAMVFGLRPKRAERPLREDARHADGRHDPGEHRRPHGRAARHVREPRAGEVAGPGAEGRPQRRSGVDEWVFQGEATSTPFGMAATVGWPRRSGASTRARYSELRPGCFDVHERVRDMNANGVLASMNFPTMAGFNARTFTEARRQGARRSSCSRPTTTGPSTSGAAPTRAASSRSASSRCGTSTSRSRRSTGIGKKGCRSISFLETPHVAGLPELPVGPLGPDAAGDRATRTWSCRCTSAPASTSSSGRRRHRSTTSSCSPARSRAHHRAGPAVRARRCASSPT